jgi:hypothetical protein
MAQLHMLVSGLWAGFWPKATAWCGLAACYGGWTAWRGDPSSGLARPSRWPNGAKCVVGAARCHGQPGLTDRSLVLWSVAWARGRREEYAGQEE